MTREQIIAGLDCLSRYTCDGCPNYADRNCPEVMTPEIAKAALELLTPAAPTHDTDDNDEVCYACGVCGGFLSRGWAYCPRCGRPVKWDG